MKIFSVSAGNYLDWKKQNTVFESMAAFGGRNVRLGGGSKAQAIAAARTDSDFFKVLRVTPAIGRPFTDEECQPGRDAVVVLSHGFAERQFGSPKNALDQTMLLNNRSYRVIGVMPSEFRVKSWFPASTDAWLPLAWTQEDAAVRGNHNYVTMGACGRGLHSPRPNRR